MKIPTVGTIAIISPIKLNVAFLSLMASLKNKENIYPFHEPRALYSTSIPELILLELPRQKELQPKYD